MRREARRSIENQVWWNDKKIVLSITAIVAIFLIMIIATTITKSINNKTNDQSSMIGLLPEQDVESITQSTSSTIGNKLDENTVNSNSNASNTTKDISTNLTNDNKISTSAKETAEKIISEKENNKSQKTDNTNVAPESNKTLSFNWPIKGEILKAYSGENLLYSSTLQEWTVHNGIDIKADKSSAVAVAEDGIVKSIKNDPRYGLTIVVEHADGYKTIYSNLLTTEFVVEGESVKKGQNIGTVGNTANFEIADEFHLHFEIMKDNEYVDPMSLLK